MRLLLRIHFVDYSTCFDDTKCQSWLLLNLRRPPFSAAQDENDKFQQSYKTGPQIETHIAAYVTCQTNRSFIRWSPKSYNKQHSCDACDVKGRLVILYTEPFEKTLGMILDHRVTERRVEEMNSTVHNFVSVLFSFEKFVLIAQIELRWRWIQMVIVHDAVNRATWNRIETSKILLTFKIFPGRSQITARSTHQLSCELH